jgi:hypothetical protein
VLLASLIKQLETDLSGDQKDQKWVVEYLSCETVRNSTATDATSDSSLSLERIEYTLIYYLYQLAIPSSNDEILTLEKCNGVFKNPKEKRATGKEAKEKKTTANNLTEKKEKDGLANPMKVGDQLPSLDEAFESLAQILDKKIFMVVDAVDIIEDAEQEEFFSDLQDLLRRSGLEVRILVSCLSDGKFYDNVIENSTPRITASDYNLSDIDMTIRTRLALMPGWTEAERSEAHTAVLNKSGSDFKYAVQVAIPFLEEPWQRPLSNRLKQLPESLTDTYNTVLYQMAPNYRVLLQTAVTWALLADGPVTVTEVMEAHIGTYDAESSQADDITLDGESPLHRVQIRGAGGPFLDYQRHGKQSIIKLKDVAAVKRFFIRSTDDNIVEQDSDLRLCPKCKDSYGTVKDLSISEKSAHLALATKLSTFQEQLGTLLMPLCSQTPELSAVSEKISQIYGQGRRGRTC